MAMASRVMPASGPVIMRSSPRMALTRVDLPTFGRPTMAMRRGWTRCLVLFASLLRDLRATVYAGGLLDEVAQLSDTDIMLGRDRQRLAEPKGEGFVHACLRRAPLHLLAATITGLPDERTSSAKISSPANDPRPRIDQENDKVRLLDGLDSLLAHAGGETRIAMLRAQRYRSAGRRSFRARRRPRAGRASIRADRRQGRGACRRAG